MSDIAHILIVEDEPEIRRFLRARLGGQGYHVSEVTSGGEALLFIDKETLDLVVLALGLPDMDGLEVIAKVRETSQVPIVVLSSRNDETSKVKALDLGADDYITKPFGMDELIARVRTALRHRLQRRGEVPVFHCSDLVVDLVRRVVTLKGKEVKLSSRE